VASDNRSGQDPFNESANGETAGSYTTDGRYRRGGWATYESKDELALNAKSSSAQTQR
jgi:hypothetical protein